MYLLHFVLIAGLFIYFYYYFKRTHNYWEKKNVIGPKPGSFFGNLKISALRQKHVANIYKEIYDKYPREKIVGIYRMTTPALIIRDLDIVKHILIKDFDMFPDRGINFSKEGLGDSLFHANVETWRALRNRMTPLFTTGKLKNMMDLLTHRGDNFVVHLESLCLKHPELEVYHLFNKFTIATILACSFGLEVDTINDNSGIFDKIDNSIFKTSYSIEMDMLFPGILTKTNSSIFSAMVNKFCHEIVEVGVCLRKGNPNARNDVFDLLLALKIENEAHVNGKDESFKVTDHVMAGQVLIFFAAGYANNSIILSYSMYHLAKNLDVQDKLIAEIDKVLLRFDGQLTYDALKQMTYLDQVFDETLRMNPTTNALQRAAAQDYKIPGTDVTIDKGMSIIISPLAIHYDERYYPNPGKFDPDRFSPENMKNRHSCSYLPFGNGPRVCIGSRFAQLQYKVCVVKMLSKFRVEPSQRTKESYRIDPMRTLLWAEGGIYLNIVPRLIK